MSEAIILGSGTSNGVPCLGVTYPDEFLANPKNHRYRSSLLLQGPEGNVLVDCTPEMRLQLNRERVTRLAAVIITHTHADHVMGMDDLRSIVIRTKEPMPVYTLPQHMSDIRRIYPYAFQDFPPGIDVPRFDLREVTPVLEIAGLRIETFKVPHGKVEVIGVKVGKFAYLTDVSNIPPEVEAMLQGLDTLVMDAVRFAPHPNHLHYEAALEWAQKLDAKMTYFTHLSDDYDHDKFEATMPERIRLAYDGLRIQL